VPPILTVIYQEKLNETVFGVYSHAIRRRELGHIALD
jgi:hypothetical protein